MTRTQRPLLLERLLVALPLILGSLVGCENKPAAVPEPEPTDVLRKAASFIEGQKNFRVGVSIEMRAEYMGQQEELKTSYLLSVARPNRLAMRPQEDESGVILVVDGKNFSRGGSALKKYVVSEAPASLFEVFDDQAANFLGLGIGGAFFDALLSDHVYDEVTKDATESRDLGTEEIEGHECQHLQFEQPNYDSDLWIDTGKQPLIRKAAFLIKQFPGLQGRQVPDMKVTVAYVLKDWELDPKFADDEFNFTAPDDWEKGDSLFTQLPARDEEAPHPLLGQPAPDFQLEKRGGGTVDLASHRDKDVVILDFWATWCGPCTRALPIISEVAAKYRDRGVAFYAVDLAETPEEVEKFLEEQKLDIPVIFDSDDAVAKLYEAHAIPQTVLIGKDGKVQVVHVGLIENLETRLSSELDDLLAGKDLAAEAAHSAKAQGDDMPADDKSDDDKPDDAKPDGDKPVDDKPDGDAPDSAGTPEKSDSEPK